MTSNYSSTFEPIQESAFVEIDLRDYLPPDDEVPQKRRASVQFPVSQAGPQAVVHSNANGGGEMRNRPAASTERRSSWTDPLSRPPTLTPIVALETKSNWTDMLNPRGWFNGHRTTPETENSWDRPGDLGFFQRRALQNWGFLGYSNNISSEGGSKPVSHAIARKTQDGSLLPMFGSGHADDCPTVGVQP